MQEHNKTPNKLSTKDEDKDKWWDQMLIDNGSVTNIPENPPFAGSNSNSKTALGRGTSDARKRGLGV